MNFNKKVFRKVENTMIAGVCGAIAEILEVDAKIVRIVYAALTVLTAIFPGIFIYLLLMLLIPKEESPLTSEMGDIHD